MTLREWDDLAEYYKVEYYADGVAAMPKIMPPPECWYQEWFLAVGYGRRSYIPLDQGSYPFGAADGLMLHPRMLSDYKEGVELK